MTLILALNEHGSPMAWATWQDVVTYKAKDLVIWETGDHGWTKYGGINRMTGEQSTVSFSSIVAIRGSHYPKRHVPPLNNINLFGRDLKLCAYCGKTYETKSLTNDHIIPRSQGGKHVWTNCVTACRRCNNHKGGRSPEQAGMDLLYVPYVPCREEFLILKNRKILADQMSFLKNSLPPYSRLLKQLA